VEGAQDRSAPVIDPSVKLAPSVRPDLVKELNARKVGDNLFVPSHTKFTVPADGKAGDCHTLSLEDGREVQYTIPKGCTPGELHIVRVDQATKTMTVAVHKGDKNSKLGIVLTDFEGDRHPVCTTIRERGFLHGLGLILVGDVFLAVSATVPPAKEPTKHEATNHQEVSDLLKSAVGEIKIEVERPEPAIPTRILHAGFLSKRSPKEVLGQGVWQRRWFELVASHLSYWELNERSDGVSSHSFLGTQRGTIALVDIAGVRQDRHDARRFDVLMKNKRLFQFYAAKPEQAADFASHINQALLDVLTVDPAPTAVIDVSDPLVDDADSADAPGLARDAALREPKVSVAKAPVKTMMNNLTFKRVFSADV